MHFVHLHGLELINIVYYSLRWVGLAFIS